MSEHSGRGPKLAEGQVRNSIRHTDKGPPSPIPLFLSVFHQLGCEGETWLDLLSPMTPTARVSLMHLLIVGILLPTAWVKNITETKPVMLTTSQAADSGLPCLELSKAQLQSLLRAPSALRGVPCSTMLSGKNQTWKGKCHLFHSHLESKKAMLIGAQSKTVVGKVQEGLRVGCQYRGTAR